MTDLEVLNERKICAICTDCDDKNCLMCDKVNGATLAEINRAFDNAIKALQEKAEMDKMRCENCKYFTIYCGGTCEGEHLCEFIRVNKTDFCSYFEPKESERK